MNIVDALKLRKRAKRWNTEDYGYICMDDDGRVYFSNEIDCDGVRYWNKRSLDKLLKKWTL